MSQPLSAQSHPQDPLDDRLSPDMANTCCPQYTIRLDARSFKPNKKHRQVINRWNRYLSTGSRESDESAQRGKGKGKGRARDGEVNDWTCDLHQQDASMVSHTHGIKFEVSTLGPVDAGSLPFSRGAVQQASLTTA